MTSPAPLATPTAAREIEGFVRTHQLGLWRFLRSIGCPQVDAEEVAQTALLLGLERGFADSTDRSKAAAFLRSSARFLWLRQRRDQRRRERLLIEHAARTWERDCAEDDGDRLLEALGQCLTALPERSRRALQLRYGEGASRADIGEALGIGEHGVRSMLQRLRAALRICIEGRMKP